MSPERVPRQPKPTKRGLRPLIGPFWMGTLGSCLGVPGLACIYRITCLPLQRHYIGQTTDAARRLLEHRDDLVNGRHMNSGLQATWDRYGPKAFSFAIMERLPARYDEGLYALAEQRWIELHWQLASAFNVRAGGTDGWQRGTDAGRRAVQVARKIRAQRAQGNFHRRNRDHL
jgi:hypothetical protein